MPEQFTKSLAQRLNQIAHIPVKEARHHEQIKEGHAYVAPGNYHMLVQKKGKDLKIVLSKEEKQKGHRPSVDVLRSEERRVGKESTRMVELSPGNNMSI